MPSGQMDQPIIEDNRDGTVSVKYEPKEEGLHELVVKYNGEHVQESSEAPKATKDKYLTNEMSENSIDSTTSNGFVLAAKTPGGNRPIQVTSHGRWRQGYQNHYQSHDSPEKMLTADTCSTSVKPGIKSKLPRYEAISESARKSSSIKSKIPHPIIRDVETRRPPNATRSTSAKPSRAAEEANNSSNNSEVAGSFGKYASEKEVPQLGPTEGMIEYVKSQNMGKTQLSKGEGKPTEKLSAELGRASDTIILHSPDPFTFGKDSDVIRISSNKHHGVSQMSQQTVKPVHSSSLQCMLSRVGGGSGVSLPTPRPDVGPASMMHPNTQSVSSVSEASRSVRYESVSQSHPLYVRVSYTRIRTVPVGNSSGNPVPSNQINASAPSNQTNASAPLNQTDASAPLNQTNASAPLNQTNTSAPLNQTNASAPFSQINSQSKSSVHFIENSVPSLLSQISSSAAFRQISAVSVPVARAGDQSVVSVPVAVPVAGAGDRSVVSVPVAVPVARAGDRSVAACHSSSRSVSLADVINLAAPTSHTNNLFVSGNRSAGAHVSVNRIGPVAEPACGGAGDTKHSTTHTICVNQLDLIRGSTDNTDAALGGMGFDSTSRSICNAAAAVDGAGQRLGAVTTSSKSTVRSGVGVAKRSASDACCVPLLKQQPFDGEAAADRACVSGGGSGGSDESFESALADRGRTLGQDEPSLTGPSPAVSDECGFLSVCSSYESLHSTQAPAVGAAGWRSRPPLGIPMSGARHASSAHSLEVRQRSLRSGVDDLLLATCRSESRPPSASLGSGVKKRRSRGDAGCGRYMSATSVSEAAPPGGGSAKLVIKPTAVANEDNTCGRCRRALKDEKMRCPEDALPVASWSLPQSNSYGSVQGSPFKFHVDSIASGYVTAHGPGLVHGITGEPSNFTISTKDAGAGGLSLAVEGPSKAEISCHDNKDGTVSVSYLPTAPGEYKVAVKFADKHIKGSPYSVKVTGEGRKRNQVSLGSQSEVTLPGKVTEKDIKALTASITAPSGLEEPCFLKKLPNDHLGISFTPREIGQHLVTVKKKDVEILGSPFKIMVSHKEVGDAAKVKVSGNALFEGKTHQDNTVLIDTKDAGYGGLSMSIEGPSKAEIKCDDKDDGKLEVSYNPKEPGFYIINLKFADHHVHGSPFAVKVTGEGTNNQTERIKRDRDAAPITTVGSNCALTFKMPGVSALDLSATVASPGGMVEDATIGELEDNLHAVNFVPKELGVHTVSVRYRDVHIPGSPFQFTVGPLKDGGAHRVHAGGPGLERGEQDMPNEFNVWTREAGAGSLAISVEGPSKADIDFKDRKDGSCYVSYIVTEPGEYRVGVKFNDSHIPDSPYKVFVTPCNKDAHKVTVCELPDAGVQVNKPIVFTVDRTGCKGQLDCKVVSPSGHEDDCFAQYLDEDTYSVRFLPKENGIHQLHVKWNNVHVPGSPFRLKVGKQDADPAAVHAHGKGLEEGHTGQKSDFIVDTCSAGAGTLAVTVDGPSKVAMDCTEVDEGYKVRYTPLSPGDYFCGIKYDGYHIAGSPFKVAVEGDDLAERGPKEQSAVVVETIEKTSVSKQAKAGPSLPKFNSNAEKVTSKGMGLKRAFVGRPNHFIVDAGKAGQDMLWVGCFGQKNPCEEVNIKHTGRSQYQVMYTVKERGKYILVVRWGEKDIPGSPFEVEV